MVKNTRCKTMWIIKLPETIVAHVKDKEAVINPKIGTAIEPCLLAYGVQVYLGDDVKTPILYGIRVVGNDPNQIAVAIKRSMAFILHRRVEIEEENIYEVEKLIKSKKEIGEHGIDFEEA